MKQTLVGMLCIVFSMNSTAQPVDGGVDPQPIQPQQADQLFRTPAGNHVRIIGAIVTEEQTVTETEIGQAVQVNGVPANSLCNIIVDAVPVRYEDEDGNLIRMIPRIPELAHTFGKTSWPVMIPGSEGDNKNVLWNIMLKGADCVSAADSPYYVASSIAELRPFRKPLSKWKCRLLRAQITETTEIDGQEVQVRKTVSACDERVNPAVDKLTVPHAWAGRKRVNFRKVNKGKLQDRMIKKAIKRSP